MPLPSVKKCYVSPSHEDNRKRLCILCLSSSKVLKTIQGKLQSKIESIVNFKINASTPTIVICTTCYSKVYKDEKIDIPDYSKFNFRSTRSRDSSSVCNCFLCETIRNRKHTKVQKTKKEKKEETV